MNENLLPEKKTVILNAAKTSHQIITNETIKMLEILAGGIAHDYNNILTVILGNLTLARSYPNNNEEFLEIFNDIEKAAILAKDMTESLLTFSKMNSLCVKRESVLAIFMRLITSLFSDNSATIDLSSEDNLWETEIDEFKLELALKNILLFLKSEFQKNKKLQIKLENLPDGTSKWLQITITDLHLVLLHDKISNLFSPGFSIKKVNHGIGLITAYSIIQKHQGLLNIVSQVDKGTSFYILIPVT